MSDLDKNIYFDLVCKYKAVKLELVWSSTYAGLEAVHAQMKTNEITKILYAERGVRLRLPRFSLVILPILKGCTIGPHRFVYGSMLEGEAISGWASAQGSLEVTQR